MQGQPLKHKELQVFSNEDDRFVEIQAGVPLIEYRESVLCPYIIIDISVIDTGSALPAEKSRGTIGLLESIKLQGTEKFKLKLEDMNGNRIDLSDDNDLRVAKTVIGKTGVRESSCFVRVVSKEAFDNCLNERRMVDNYIGKGDDIIFQALRNLGTEKNRFFDTTKNEIQFNGDNRYPFEMCLDVQKVSVHEELDSAGYLFWETSKGYNFKSLDNMFNTKDKVIKSFEETGFASDQISPGFDAKILKSNFVLINDMLKQFEEGAYNAELDLFDLLGKDNKFQLQERLTPGNGEPNDKKNIIAGTVYPVLREEYREKPTADLHRTKDDGQKVLSDGSLADVNDVSFDIVKTSLQSLQNYRQKFSSSLNIVIDADLSLNAGDLVFCKFAETAAVPFPEGSRKNSGIYMIADLCHYSTPTQAYTGLNLVRDSYGVK
tara:strand:+ start:547 stop:1845 length:1299 start_codon:yes stop_codon:yes gene_type:complete